jgi:hypothetical protein
VARHIEVANVKGMTIARSVCGGVSKEGGIGGEEEGEGDQHDRGG